jgi:hypothetical protein
LLTSRLRFMKNPKSFLLYVTAGAKEEPQKGFFLLRRQLFNLVEQLPVQVEWLELVTIGHERRRSDDDSYHICQLIAQRMPHLKHLRVRLNTKCGQIICASSNIQSIVISNIGGNRRSYTRLCGNQKPLDVDGMTGARIGSRLALRYACASSRALASWYNEAPSSSSYASMTSLMSAARVDRNSSTVLA